jgi:hypothetical protein
VPSGATGFAFADAASIMDKLTTDKTVIMIIEIIEKNSIVILTQWNRRINKLEWKYKTVVNTNDNNSNNKIKNRANNSGNNNNRKWNINNEIDRRNFYHLMLE